MQAGPGKCTHSGPTVTVTNGPGPRLATVPDKGQRPRLRMMASLASSESMSPSHSQLRQRPGSPTGGARRRIESTRTDRVGHGPGGSESRLGVKVATR
jgi:hypothetical protein